MTIYLVNSFSSSDKAFTDKQLAEAYLEEVDKDGIFINHLMKPIELVTDQFMEQILQPKEQHEINTNSSAQ